MDEKGGVVAPDRRPFVPERGLWRPPAVVLVVVALVAAFAYYGWAARNGFGVYAPVTAVERRAVDVMEQGIDIIADARRRAGVPIDERVDPNRTGLIGVEYSSITTTVGDLVAKRTATHPYWAGVIARWMEQVGVGPGDLVWATFSGSFPGFNLAVLAAAEAIGAELISVTSLAASTWGANLPEFPWSDMERALHDAGLVQGRTIAWTLGGDDDQGPGMLDLFGDGEASLRAAAARTDAPLVETARLEDAVRVRWELLTEASEGRRPALYVNAGGGHASFGGCTDAHLWPSGLTWTGRTCQGAPEGFLYVAANEGVPVLHLLNAKSLALQSGIPVDAQFRTSSK